MNDMAFQQSANELRSIEVFAGGGGGILGDELLGIRTVCAVERDAYAAQVLAQRQNDGCFPPFPIWSDVESFDGKAWRGRADMLSGGFPCQDISTTGQGAGIDGAKSSLYRHQLRIAGEMGAIIIRLENSPALTIRGIGTVLGDLATMGYDAEWGVLGAVNLGAEHERFRIWIVAYSDSAQLKRRCVSIRIPEEHAYTCNPRWGQDKPGVDRASNGLAFEMDRLRATGNGQVPAVAARAFTECLRRIIT